MEGREFSARGAVIDRLAREKKRVRGAKPIAEYLKKYAVENEWDLQIPKSRSTVSNYLYGDTVPEDDWLTLFAVAFELTHEEMGELAYSHTLRLPSAA